MIRKLIFTFLLSVPGILLYSQIIDHPNYGLKSHETLDIESVVLTAYSTTVFMVVENRSLDGTFCADKNIYLLLPDGKRIKIRETEGIPRCPETYVFQRFGERLYFSLSFPPLPEGIEWFDLVEDCSDACFSFQPVILDAVLNQKIDHAYAMADAGDLAEARNEFEALLTDFAGKNCSYGGAVYWNLVTLSKKLGDEATSKEWMEALVNSDTPLKEKYIESLGGR